VVIILVAIGGYLWLLVIGGYYINGYFIGGYMVVIILMAIGGY
jgi:hypothetical protein